MRKKLYLAIIEKLKGLTHENGSPMIQHFDLWNQNVEFIQEESPWPRPAVFIEFTPIQWRNLQKGIQTADITFILHVVTDWNGGSADGSCYQEQSLEVFDLLDTIHGQLNRLGRQYEDNSGFRNTLRVSSATNHNHEEIREDIETYTANIIDVSGEVR